MDRGNQLTLESLGPPELDVLLRPGDMRSFDQYVRGVPLCKWLNLPPTLQIRAQLTAN